MRTSGGDEQARIIQSVDSTWRSVRIVELRKTDERI